jgi:tetratricopeptide (TPR) repeat protein
MVVTACASARNPGATFAPRPASGNAPSIESQDKALAAGLLRLLVHPSPDAEKAVSAEYTRLGLLEDAFAHLTAAIQMDKRDAEAYDGRARIWRDWGFPARGLGDAARAVYFAPRSAAAHNTWGTLLAGTGSLADARREFDRARALDPDGGYAQTNLCYVEFVSGDIPEAIADCLRALEIDPGSIVAKNNLALSFAAAGQYATAAEEFLATGDVMRGHYNTGVALLAAGRFADARKAFETVSASHALGRLARARAEQARALAAGTLALGPSRAATDR